MEKLWNVLEFPAAVIVAIFYLGFCLFIGKTISDFINGDALTAVVFAVLVFLTFAAIGDADE